MTTPAYVWVDLAGQVIRHGGSPKPPPPPPPPPPSGMRFPGDTQPKTTGQLYMGASVKGGGSPSPWETAAGVKFGIRHRYDGGSPDAGPLAVPNGSFANWITEDHAAGRLPLLGWHLSNDQWGLAAGGKYDTQINAFIAYVEGLAKPVYLIVDHEPEDGNATDYKAWMNHIRSLINTYKAAHGGTMKRLVFMGCFQAATFAGSHGGIASWWPGDGVYDVLGLDGYAWDAGTAMPSANMTTAMNYCAAHNQPFGWSEYGVTPSDPQGGTKIAHLYSLMTSKAYDCIFLAYFSVNGPAWQLNTSNGTYQQFIAELKAPASVHMRDLGY